MKLGFFIIGLLLITIVIIDRYSEEKNPQTEQTHTFIRNKNPIRFEKQDNVRTKIFGILYEINKIKKKVRYIPGELIVDDFELSQNDQFLDLLDLLFEQDKLIMIEIPDQKSIRESLRLAGFSTDFITLSKYGIWRIKIKE